MLEWFADRAAIYAAAFSSHMLLALAPLVVIAAAVIGLFLSEDTVAELVDQAGINFGEATQDAVEVVLNDMTAHTGASTIALIISGVVLIFTAAGAFRSLRKALNAIWNVEPAPTGRDARKIGWRLFLQLLLTLMVLGLGVLIAALMALSALWGTLTEYVAETVYGGEWLLRGADFLFSLGLITLVFALLFTVMPLAHIDRRDLWLGSLLTAVLFDIGRFAFGIYMDHSATASAYGAVGSLVIFLIWVYYSAMIIFYGAEVAQVHGRHHGREVRPRRGARLSPRPSLDP